MGIWNSSVEPREYNENVSWNLWDTCFPHSSLLPGARCIKRKQQCFMNSSFSFHVFWEDKQQFPKANGYCTSTATVFKTYIYIIYIFVSQSSYKWKFRTLILPTDYYQKISQPCYRKINPNRLYVHPSVPPSRKCELKPCFFTKFFSYSKYSTPIIWALKYMHSDAF